MVRSPMLSSCLWPSYMSGTRRLLARRFHHPSSAAKFGWVHLEASTLTRQQHSQHPDTRSWDSPLSAWPLRPLASAATARRDSLRAACVSALDLAPTHTLVARGEVPTDSSATRADATAALTDGLGLAALLPSASAAVIADVHSDVLACVALWAQATGRSRASVLVTLTAKRREALRLHLDHVDVRVLCALCGKGTEWVAPPPGWLHAAASWADHGRGGAIADGLKDAVAAVAATTVRAAAEREVVMVRGTANRCLRRGEARLHRGPDNDPDAGEWRLLVKVDDGPGWWRDESLRFLYRPSASRQTQTWGQLLVDVVRGRKRFSRKKGIWVDRPR